jgi:nucleotide-binding universal stress UspA family protein
MTRRYAVAYDDSPGARAALRWALELARRDHAQVVAVSAWTMPTLAVSPWIAPPVVDEAACMAAFGDELAAGVASVRSEVDGAPEVPLDVRPGPAGPTVLDAAATADLLVVGRRGHGGFAGLLLGSVSATLAHHTPCPLVIVPPASRTG